MQYVNSYHVLISVKFIGGGAGQRVRGPTWVVGIVKVQGESGILFGDLGAWPP